MCYTWLCPGHFNKHVGDSARQGEEIIKISHCTFQCDYYHYHCYQIMPEKYHPRLSHCFVITKFWQGNQREQTHNKKSDMLDSTQTKCLQAQNYPKSMCTVSEFWRMPNTLHPHRLSHSKPVLLYRPETGRAGQSEKDIKDKEGKWERQGALTTACRHRHRQQHGNCPTQNALENVCLSD